MNYLGTFVLCQTIHGKKLIKMTKYSIDQFSKITGFNKI